MTSFKSNGKESSIGWPFALMIEIELKFKINGREAQFDRLVEVLKQELVQAVEGAAKQNLADIAPARTDRQTGSEPRAYIVAEAAKLLSLSEATISRRIREGKISAVRVGSRVLVPTESIRKLLQDVRQSPQGRVVQS
jgi:excisionase family DNA binding protein